MHFSRYDNNSFIFIWIGRAGGKCCEGHCDAKMGSRKEKKNRFYANDNNNNNSDDHIAYPRLNGNECMCDGTCCVRDKCTTKTTVTTRKKKDIFIWQTTKTGFTVLNAHTHRISLSTGIENATCISRTKKKKLKK